MYYINYGTGAGNETAETLEEAMKIADAGACYTQTDIVITNDDGEEWMRFWYGIAPTTDDLTHNIIRFGDAGFYDEWCKTK